jgi:uncharacterized protein
MIGYSLYLYLPDSAKAGMTTYAADKVLDILELMLIEGKFYTIFSVLFGVGFSILLSRSRAKDLLFHRFFLRRVFFLYLFGVAHAVLFWHNDILIFYALCGALLLLVVSVRDRTIIAIAALVLLAPIPIKLVGGIPSDFFTEAQIALLDRFGLTSASVIQTWTAGSPGDIVRLNLSKWFSQASFLVTSGMLFKIFGCFLLGFCIGRHEIHGKLELYRPLAKRIAVWGIAIGLPLNVGYAASFSSGSWLEVISGTFGVLPLSEGYASLLCLIWLGPKGQGLLTSLCSCRSNGADELRGPECHLHVGVLRNRARARRYNGPDTLLTHRFRCVWISGAGEPVVARSFPLWTVGVDVADVDVWRMVSTGEERGKFNATCPLNGH